MMKNIKKRLVGLTAIAASAALVFSVTTTALAAGRDYMQSAPVQAGTNAAGPGSCRNNPSDFFTQNGGKSFSITDLENILGKFCDKGSLNAPKDPSSPDSQTPAPTAAPTSAPTAAPSGSNAPATAPDNLSAMEEQMVQLVNSERSKAGAPALKANADLANMARVKSQDMINNGYFSHNSPTYGSPFDMMNTFGISFRTAGENIAMNQSVEAAHASLMNSDGHRANILNPAFTQIGIGIVSDGHGNLYITQEFIG